VDGTKGFGGKYKVIIWFNVGNDMVIEVMLKEDRVAILVRQKRLSSKSDGELCEILTLAQLLNKSESILSSKHWLLINDSDVGTSELVVCGSERTVGLAGTAIGKSM
jgi:hypothetical protein